MRQKKSKSPRSKGGSKDNPAPDSREEIAPSPEEELQSANEEIQFSNEELQSINEELSTLNEELQHRNAELSQSSNDLLNLINSANLPMVMIGNDLRIRKFSPAAEKLLNLIPTDIGRPFTDIKLNLTVHDLEQKIEEVINTVRPMEEAVRDRKGRRYLLRIRPYKTLESRIEGAVIVLVDVDAPIAQETQILNRVYQPIFVWNPDVGILYWNEAAKETYGYSKEEALGKMPENLLDASPSIFMEDLWRNGRWSGEVVHRRKDGTPIVLKSRVVLYQEPAAEALIIEANFPGFEESGKSKLIEGSGNAQGSHIHRSDFLTKLAHELRNPLAPLRNAVQVLHHPDANEEMRARALRMLDRQVQGMTRMVNDLLDVSRLAQGKVVVKKENVDLTAVLRRSIDEMAHHVASREQEIEVAIPEKRVLIEGDPARLEQIFTNLLSNASKFTPDRGHISVRLEESDDDGSPETENNRVVVRVRDDGFGISPEQLPGIFDGLEQGHSESKSNHSGLGIGLSLVRDLVAQHGGTVEAMSDGQGKGSEFVVRLPKPGSAVLEKETVPIPAKENRKILVVDDNVDAADSLAILLRMAGYVVEIAYDGLEALKTARSFQPDVVLLDIGLPGMDGYEVVQELKAMPEMQQSVLVAVTGYARDDDRRRAREEGFHFHLTKPINHESLKALLDDRS